MMIDKEKSIKERIRRIDEVVSKASGLPIDYIREKERSQDKVQARWVAWYIAYQYAGISYLKIAKEYGRDHTTILYGIDRIKKDEYLPKVIEKIRQTTPEILEQLPIGKARPLAEWQF